MKRTLITIGMVLASCAAMAATQVVDGIEWTYTVSGGKASVTTANPATGAVAIPSILGDHPVTSIGFCAFYMCRELTSVTIPDGVTSIGNSAFGHCSGLTRVTIPSSVTSISSSAFYDCSGLTTIDVSVDNVNYVSLDGALFNKALTELVRFPGCKTGSYVIPSSVTNIGDYAFSSCSGLTSVTIPEGVTSIGDSAFHSCTGLTSIAIPSSVTHIGVGAFWGCSGLMTITVAETNPAYSSVNGVLFNEDKTTICDYPGGKSGTYVIPSSVTHIGNCAFCGCTVLTGVTIPEGVTFVGRESFAGCSGLTSVTIPSSVTYVGSYAFMDCGELTNVVFHGNAPGCGNVVFYDVAIGCTATVYEGTTGWDDDGDGQWDELTLVWRDAPKPDGGPYTETVGETEWTFEVSSGKATVTEVNPATGAVTIPSALGGRSVTSIDASAFLQCTDLTSVTIPASVTTIGNSAFWGCTNLKDVIFEGDTISSIEHEAFTDCYWDLIMHVPSTWKGRGRTICGYTVLKGSMFIVK